MVMTTNLIANKDLKLKSISVRKAKAKEEEVKTHA
jgi:hypothetical protein